MYPVVRQQYEPYEREKEINYLINFLSRGQYIQLSAVV